MARCHLLILLLPLFLALAAAAPGHGQDHHGEASAVFIDAVSHRYLRDQQAYDQEASMSLNEVSAIVSVLLGFAPPTSLPALSSSQLNKVLLPNPFDRPHAVFLVQIAGSNGMPVVLECFSIFKTRIEGVNNAATGLTDKDELIIIHSDESLDLSGSDYLDSELSSLANWLEGSYQKSSGKLVIPLESGNSLTLLLHKEADLEFASSLASLLKTIERAVQVHEDFSGVISPAELLVCHFTGIKALEDEYASAETIKQGTKIVQRAVTKAFQYLYGAYKGNLPSAIEHDMKHKHSLCCDCPVCLLMNMPLTRDTLLYSNVKID
ncbi:hypothetical protein BAE44_0007046 [Dichanthelium oligosanthes]|uniref:DUF7794 domain-containing protein n=1 Tax=Dichanthelium oligosanthes TaxID=888268 RepID=A0A1E5W3Q5_9POAL|nr:hypothetical protein BAE44_0007046 [Dichanthelium oligosanthes]